MQKLNSRAVRIALVVLLLVLVAIFLRKITEQSQSAFIVQASGFLRAMIYFGLVIAWSLSIRQRIMQKQVRLYILFVSGLMLYWLAARTMRYFFVIENSDIYHFLWYSYYIPMLLISLISIFMALHLGKREDYRLTNWTFLLYIPTLLLIVLVLTNDFHQLVFIPPDGAGWVRLHYQYRIGYWLVFAWMLLCALATLVILITKSRLSRNKRILCLPFVPLLIYVVYAILYAIRIPFIHSLVGDMTAVFCLLIMGIFESCIQVGLIRSNTNYAELLYASGIAAQIVDKDYKVYYRAEAAQYLTEDVMRQAENGPIVLEENIRLSSVAITGGHALWIEDVSEMNRLLSELKEVGELLSENNDLLQAELELKERQAAVDEKNRLYDRVTKEVASQLKTLDDLLSDGHSKAIPIRERLTWLCVLGTYIKRRSNLIILSEDDYALSVKELEYCLLESVEAISSGGIDCYLKRGCDGVLPTVDTVLLYDLFEEAVEKALPSLSALFVLMAMENGYMEIKLQLNYSAEDMFIQKLPSLSEFKHRGGQANEVKEDDTLHVAFRLPLGGKRV